jgi:hypothetical protein
MGMSYERHRSRIGGGAVTVCVMCAGPGGVCGHPGTTSSWSSRIFVCDVFKLPLPETPQNAIKAGANLESS